MTTAQAILQTILSLPSDKQEQVLAYAERIKQESGSVKQPLFNPEGMSAGLGGDLSFEEFQKNRREMWGTSTDRELE